MKIHASGEDYLEAVLILQKKQGMVRSIDRETAERDACRIEHVISEEAFEKLKTSVEKKY